MHVLQARRHLEYVVPYLWLINATVLRLMASDDLLEISLLGPLYSDEELVVLDEGVEVLDDVLAIERLRVISPTYRSCTSFKHLSLAFESMISKI